MQLVMELWYPPIPLVSAPLATIPNPPFRQLQYGTYSATYPHASQETIVPPPQMAQLAPTSTLYGEQQECIPPQGYNHNYAFMCPLGSSPMHHMGVNLVQPYFHQESQ